MSAAITTYPLNGVDYDAADVAAYESTRTSGVYSAEEDFAVAAAGGLDVTVSAGRALVHPNRFEGYSITKREVETLTLALADGSRPRIDRIVLRYDAAARKTSLLVLQGEASSSPAAPEISRTSLLYDLCLAEITRPAGSTTITTGDITVTRLDEDLCGIMSDGVTGIPTEELLTAAKARVAALEETASASAAKADASQKAAASSEVNSKGYAENAAGSASSAAQALQNVKAAHTTALQDISDARAGALDDVATSTQTATNAATTATQKAGEASASANAAAESQQAAADSAAAAGESQAASESAQKKAEAAAELAGTRAGTDTSLTVEGAPADAKAVGDALSNISIDIMTGATAEEAGKAGLVPAPGAGAQEYFLRGDGSWAEVTIPEYAAATQTTPGLMGAADKKRLDNLYPVGSIYMSTASTSPASLYGGTWEEIASERVLMGRNSTHAAASTVAAGLPNITGSFVADVYRDQHATSGAISAGSELTSRGENSGSDFKVYKFSLNASKSSAVYGKSTTVQPAAYYVYIWRRTK